MKDVIFCIDIGGTKTAYAAYTADGEELVYNKFPTRPERGADDLVERLRSAASVDLDGYRIVRGVVASPGPLDARNGVIIDVVTMGWKNVALTDKLQQAFGVTFSLLNDCDAGALGVWRYGGYAHCRSLAYVSISTGIGGGAIVDGKLVTGRGNAADFGHIPVLGDRRKCGCGRMDCLELYASGSGIERLWRELTGQPLPCATIADLARKGNVDARSVFMRAGKRLAQGVGAIKAILDPEVIVFGGSVTKAGDLFFPTYQSLSGEAEVLLANEDGKQVLLGCLAFATTEQ